MQKINIDTEELAHFNEFATGWWDPKGSFKTLHDINPLRLSFITNIIALKTQKVIDVGCGGGILTEAMAKKGAYVIGIDAAECALQVAQSHAAVENLNIEYK